MTDASRLLIASDVASPPSAVAEAASDNLSDCVSSCEPVQMFSAGEGRRQVFVVDGDDMMESDWATEYEHGSPCSMQDALRQHLRLTLARELDRRGNCKRAAENNSAALCRLPPVYMDDETQGRAVDFPYSIFA